MSQNQFDSDAMFEILGTREIFLLISLLAPLTIEFRLLNDKNVVYHVETGLEKFRNVFP